MNSAAAVSLAFLLGTAALAAQTATQGNEILVQKSTTTPSGATTWTTQTVTPAEVPSKLVLAMEQIAQQINGCPVTMRARHAPGGDSMKVDGAAIKGPAQRLHLMVTDRDARQIVAANVTVRGLTGKPRLTQTLGAPDAADAAKTLEVRFAAEPGKEKSADFAVPGLTAATFVELNSVTYADGSTWKLAGGSACRSAIDGTMLIGNR
jgi:hypothetical protein